MMPPPPPNSMPNSRNDIDYSQFKNSEFLMNISCKLWLIINAITVPRKLLSNLTNYGQKTDQPGSSINTKSRNKSLLFSYDMILQILHRLNELSFKPANILHCKKILKLLLNHRYIISISREAKSHSTCNLCLEFDVDITSLCHKLLSSLGDEIEYKNEINGKILATDPISAKIMQQIALHLLLEQLNIPVYTHILSAIQNHNETYENDKFSIFKKNSKQNPSIGPTTNSSEGLLNWKLIELMKTKIFNKNIQNNHVKCTKYGGSQKIADNSIRLKNIHQYLQVLETQLFHQSFTSNELYASINFVIYELFPHSLQIIFPSEVAEFLSKLAFMRLKGESSESLIYYLKLIFVLTCPSLYYILKQIVESIAKLFDSVSCSDDKSTSICTNLKLRLFNSLIQQLCFGTENFSIYFAKCFTKIALQNSSQDMIYSSNNIVSQQLVFITLCLPSALCNRISFHICTSYIFLRSSANAQCIHWQKFVYNIDNASESE
ncbi:MAG: hypothetical protein MHMPM18_000515 [Marteilia pararefringens]